MVRILGIDPGTQVAGFGCLEAWAGAAAPASASAPLALRAGNVVRLHGGAGARPRVVELGVMRLGARNVPLALRLLALAEQFRQLLERLHPHEIALEEAFSGKSVQAALRIGEARGVVLAESARAGLSVHQFAPARVKRSITGHGAASKQGVAAMVAQQVRLDGAALAGVPADATDAVAVALARFEQRRSPLQQLSAVPAAIGRRPDRAGCFPPT
ncbi:MAG: crossover junction endodeoxyribonuclease RuvC [Planctomycetes bacterium]|nr:crossover junction endodeoxyribonuclease RuvC [Planctomycetota bacterium]